MTIGNRLGPVLALALTVGSAGAAGAWDGSMAATGGGVEGAASAAAPTYYEDVLGGAPLAEAERAGGGLPGSLHVVDAAGAATYESLASTKSGATWQLTVEVAERPHERVDAVYDLVVAIPLPVEPDGSAAFEPSQFGIAAREGSLQKSVAFVYGGEKVVLKRNVALERSWLPVLTGASGGLPDLRGTGQAFTLWDTVLRYDPGQGPTMQAHGRLQYDTPGAVAAPNPADDRNAVYVINWIPTLDPTIPPFTLRIDVEEPAAGP